MRLLIVTPAFVPAYALGGPVFSIEGIAGALAKRQVEVSVLTTNSNGRDTLSVTPGWQPRDGYRVRYLPRWLPPDLTPSLLWEAMHEGASADLIHVNGVFSLPSVQGILAGMLTGTPVVLSPRGSFEPLALQRSSRRKRGWLRAIRHLLHHVSMFHATSNPEAASICHLLDRLRVNASVSVVPNGVATSVVPSVKQAGGTPKIRALGRIHPVKGYERLIGAIGILREAGNLLEVEIAGPIADGTYYRMLMSLVRQLSLADTVKFRGPLYGSEKIDFLAGATVVVLSSFHENFGNVVTESLACGTPVIASDTTPWRLLQERGVGNWVSMEPPYLLLAECIRAYLDSRPDETQARSGRARDLAQAEFSWSTVSKSMLAAYHSVLG